MSIVGHGPEKPKLEVLTKTRHLSDYVVIKEGLSDQDLLKEYARSKIFLHLSELEGFSLSIFEALSMGCRVIALYLPVYDEVYKGRLNYLYQKDDNEGFVNYMLS